MNYKAVSAAQFLKNACQCLNKVGTINAYHLTVSPGGVGEWSKDVEN